MTQTPADRYGRRTRDRRPFLIAVGVVAALAVGWAAWFAVTVGNPDVTWQDVGFSTGPDGVDVTFEVVFKPSLPDGARAVCSVQAQNAVHTVVGAKDVTVGPAGDRRLRVTARVPTSEPPVTGLVRDCAMTP